MRTRRGPGPATDRGRIECRSEEEEGGVYYRPTQNTQSHRETLSQEILFKTPAKITLRLLNQGTVTGRGFYSEISAQKCDKDTLN